MISIYKLAEQEFAHEHTPVPTRQRKSNGVTVVVLQCSQCGERLREVSKSLYNIEALPWFDESLRKNAEEKKQAMIEDLQEKRDEIYRQQVYAYRQEREKEQEERAREWRIRQDAENQTWWDKYTLYLNSPHWVNLRLAVIQRDNHKCQNCFRPVTEKGAHVHHTSYVGFNRLGYSYAFECVTLCSQCHVNFHPDRAMADDAQN